MAATSYTFSGSGSLAQWRPSVHVHRAASNKSSADMEGTPHSQCHALKWASKPEEAKLLSYLLQHNPDTVLAFHDGQHVPAHSTYLAFNSPVLADMLQVAHGDAASSPVLLHMGEDDIKHWLHTLRIVYSAPSPAALDWEAVTGALFVADKYAMEKVLLVCTKWVTKNKLDAVRNSPCYALRLLELGDRYHLDDILQMALRFIESEVAAGRKIILADEATLSRVSSAVQAKLLAFMATAEQVVPAPVLFQCGVCYKGVPFGGVCPNGCTAHSIRDRVRVVQLANQ